MTPPTSSDDEQFSRLRERVETEPGAVAVEDAIATLRADPPAGTDSIVETFTALAGNDPDCTPTVIERLVALFEVEHTPTRRGAVIAVAAVAAEHTEHAEGAIAPLIEFLGSDPDFVGNYALAALEPLAAAHPSLLTPAVPVLRSRLGSEHYTDQALALGVTSELARHAPAAVASTTSQLVALVTRHTDENARPERAEEFPELQDRLQRQDVQWMRLRTRAALTLVEIADARPERLVEHVSRLSERLDDESAPPVREATYDVLWSVAQYQPAAVRPVIDILACRLQREDDPEILGKVSRVLGVLADAYLEAVVDAVEPATATLIELLEEDDPFVQGSVTGLLAYVAEREPQLIEPARPRLVVLAESGPQFVRGSAIWTLSFVADEAATSRLRALADTDPDPEMRRVASAALDHDRPE